jgi:hypothetical protein
MISTSLVPLALAMVLGAVVLLATSPRSTDTIGVQVVERDAFPVFDNPKMVAAHEAEARGLVLPRDMVIGVARGRKAKAYPIAIMGVHELGNDTIDGIPIAVTW